jgi:predicted transcriptional regulator
MDPQKMFSGRATCEDVMECFFNLNDNDLKLYRYLLKKGPKKMNTLSKAIKKDKTTAYRSLQKLISCGLCYRETKTIPRGGHFHVYSAVSPDLVKLKIQSFMDQWNLTMKKILVEFDEKFLFDS